MPELRDNAMGELREPLSSCADEIHFTKEDCLCGVTITVVLLTVFANTYKIKFSIKQWYLLKHIYNYLNDCFPEYTTVEPWLKFEHSVQ